ncbi:MAG: 4Fe-4S ferredoxin [Spirochaetota bacterium]|nr:MAG: 4Fe-4S ferredoxin [Spirochaetota bacterium]
MKILPNDTNDGILSVERIRGLPGYPGEERIEKGSVVVIECDEDIPCNPCEDICPENAITVGDPITNLPRIDPEKCDGCIVCISICPGLCMFVLHKNYSDSESLIYLPYEMYPLPEKGDEVKGCNRKGEIVCKARVQKVIKGKKLDKTSIIAISVPKAYYEVVRAIKF